MRVTLKLITLLLISSFFMSCQEDKPTFVHPKEDYVAFAKKLESTLKKGDSLFLDTAFDKKSFLKKMNDGKEGDKKLITTDINEAFTEGVMSRMKFGTEIAKNLEGGYYNFLKYYTTSDGVPHLVFRLFGKTGLNYHDFEMVERDGIIKIADCYILITGEELSQTIRNAYMSMSNSQDILGFSISSDMDEEAVKSAKSITTIRGFLIQEKYEEALAELNTIPEKYRKQKLFRLLEVEVMASQDESSYMKSMEDFQRDFPEDPSLSLILIDHYFLKEDYSSVLKSLNNLQKTYGDDFILDLYKGNCYYQMKDYKKAAQSFRNLTKAIPDYMDGWNSLLTSYIEAKEYAAAVIVADKLITSFGFTKGDIILFATGYPDFTASREYQTWASK